jgi:high-affinity K+ transport system ATPase subunit B
MRERIARLREMGIRTIMVTGDNPVTALAVAAQAGVDDFVAEAKPEEKLRLIRREQAQGRLVAMTGDGTNDAPALAQADVGLAMHSGTIAAKEAANLIDLDSDPTKLIDLVSIGKQMLITRGALTTFSVANDVAKYFAIIPAMFTVACGLERHGTGDAAQCGVVGVDFQRHDHPAVDPSGTARGASLPDERRGNVLSQSDDLWCRRADRSVYRH